jgi:hypothetical protein
MPPRPDPSTWLPLLHRALAEEIGIRFRLAGVPRESFRNRLYEARIASGDPRLEELIMFLPATPETQDEIWICKKAVELEP